MILRASSRYQCFFSGAIFFVMVLGGLGCLRTNSQPEVKEGSIPLLRSKTVKIPRNSTLYETLVKEGFARVSVFEIVKAAKPHHNLSRIRTGSRIQIFKTPGPIQVPTGMRYLISEIEYLDTFLEKNGTWVSKKTTEVVDTRLVTYSGNVMSSLWESASRANMDSQLIAELTEIFAWQVDFAREVRPGDRWRLTVEQNLVHNRVIGWGKIVAAEYENEGTSYSAVLFRRKEAGEDVDFGYFFPDGNSLRRMFLKSPIRFGRISSRFRWRRLHPILKTRRPHLGVDYAAPRGTPVRAVGDGRVTYVGRRGGGGKTIKIRHNSYYHTAYKHLNGYASGIRGGARVKQGQVIGYVGSTGLATGPHLHFEFYEGGRFVDPLGKKFPSADPVPQRWIHEFKIYARQILKTLPLWFRPGVTSPGPIKVASESPGHKTVEYN